MSATRSNKGKPAGLFLAELGSWNLCQTAEGRYKVYAKDAVNGKANYAFAVKVGTIDTHSGLDASKLRDERPELYKTVAAYFKASVETVDEAPVTKTEEEADPYGDLALSRRKRLTPEQNWKRGLLNMRRIDMEHAAAKKQSVWESAVRLMYAAIFKQKIPDDEVQKTIHWITQRQGEIDLGELLRVETEYYAGKYNPNASRTLEEQLDMIANNNNGFENVEETDGTKTEGRDGLQGLQCEEAGADGGGETVDILSAAVPRGGAERTDDPVSGSGEDLFSDFQ